MSASVSTHVRSTSDDVDTNSTPDGVSRSVYSQVTVDPAETKPDDPDSTSRHQNRFMNGSLLHASQQVSESPRNISPEKGPSPSPPAKPHTTASSRTSPNLRSGRFGDAATSEQSPITNRMSTVPEDEVPATEDGTRGPRKSVQFSRNAPDIQEHPSQSHTPIEDESKTEAPKAPSLYSRLRALASSQHVRSPSAISFRSQDNRDERTDATLSATIEDNYTEDDADEESGAEGAFVPSQQPKKKRKFVRRADLGPQADSAPASPHGSRPELSPANSSRPSQFALPFQLHRRVTDPDMVSGVSEDEGRRKLEHTLTSSWTPRHPLRGLSHGGQREERLFDGPSRPLGPLLSVNTGSTQAGGNTTADEAKPKRKMFPERGSTLSGARWRQLKNGLKALAKPKPKERLTQDQAKSAELLAELAAAAPAALMFASAFQRDEHDDRRIPALLEQLKVSVTDTEQKKDTEDSQHIIFRIELEYGNGVNRMKWVIRRALRDFVNMHFKYKSHYQFARFKGSADDRRLYKNFPKFPKAVFPVLQGIGDFDDEDEEDPQGPDAEGALTDPERPGLPARSRTRTSFILNRRRSSLTGDEATPTTPGGTLLFRKGKDKETEKERDLKFPARQRQMLEIYLQRLIKFMLFRPEANRLCRFLEISALGMRLASEGSYHGKEGYMIIRSAKGLDFRKSLTPGNIKSRHTPKWFLVRHSYIVCVDSPDGMFIYDVFLFDSDFSVQSSKPLLKNVSEKKLGKTAKEIAANSKEMAKHPQHHRLKLINSERRLKLLARNERVLRQFEESLRKVIITSPWCQKNRFDSFAPVRTKCFAQWLVDGRDHMWVVSRALDQAKDVIYIHDWWLSPELYMRRPAAISQKWRLDRILKRKAEQGVKIFVIVYRNIDAAIPIDSQYTKFSLLDLHPNIFVQRSPNQFRQNTFFWAHHEKLCIVDHTLAFVGGIDLCFGRWDTPQHILNDDKPTGFEDVEAPKDGDHCQLWPGKDYSNPRVQDFFDLFKPYEEMYNRNVVARMPWHDISMQVVGQPARDLTRHFVQRWNYILRQRKPTRPTPFLLPPPDFNPADLEALGLDGTCEVQLLRSAGPWSIGTPDKTEHSIMNAYIKMIEESEHFVYMENQFFITSCETESSRVHNRIGDALVERIIRAANNDEAWRAVIIIPLVPGFQNTVEEEGGTSVRLIMQYQYRSICRGESSIFGRLKAHGIEPEDYIQFYSLRQWGKIGPKQSLVTEQLYIHAKIIIVDDRIALIGSANINERSQLGNRDSEVAAVVRDTDMLWSTMNGKPYRVGRFAYTLRVRLMREHLGLDVDQIMEDAQILEHERTKSEGKAKQPKTSHKDADSENEDPLDARGREFREELLQRNEMLATFNHDVDWEQAGNPNLRANKQVTKDSRVTGTDEHKRDINGEGFDAMRAIEEVGLGAGRDTITLPNGKEVLVKNQDTEGHLPLTDPRKHGMTPRIPSYVKKVEAPNPPMPPRPGMLRKHTEELGLTQLSQLPALPETDDADIGGPTLEKVYSEGSASSVHPLFTDLKHPLVDRDCMLDPIISGFADDTWHSIAENNTRIYRSVFRCMPDNNVRDWNDYHEYMAYEQRFKELQGQNNISDTKFGPQSDQNKRAGPVGVGSSTVTTQLKGLTKVPTDLDSKIRSALGDEHAKTNEGDAEKKALQDWAAETNRAQMQRQGTDLSVRAFPSLEEKHGLQSVPEDGDFVQRPDSKESQGDAAKTSSEATEKANGSAQQSGSVRRRRRGTTRSSRRDFSAADDMMSLADAEELLGRVQGHLIEFPYDWLEKVEAGGNWLFPFDQISPIEIYI